MLAFAREETKFQKRAIRLSFPRVDEEESHERHPVSRVIAIRTGEFKMLWTIFVVLGILWLLGFSLHIGGGLIHLLLVVALVVLVFNLLTGRRSVV